MMSRETLVVGSVICGSLLGLAMLPGVRWDAVGDDRRRSPATYDASPQPMAEALRQADVAVAERLWREAYIKAVRAQAWRPLADLGDAAVRIADRGGPRTRYVALARQAYVAALVRARAERSAEGIARICRAFRGLGDHDIADQCAIIAETLQARRLAESPPTEHAARAIRRPIEAP
jgi:hypothetical protein